VNDFCAPLPQQTQQDGDKTPQPGPRVKEEALSFREARLVETTVEELVVLGLVEDVDELVVLVTELVDLDVVTDAEVAAPDS